MVQHSRSTELTELNRFILDINNSNNELCEWASQLAYGSLAEDAKVQSVWFHSVTIHLQPFVGTATSMQRFASSIIMHSRRLTHSAFDTHAYVDSDWATCLRTRRLFTYICIRLAGGTLHQDEIANHGRLILDRGIHGNSGWREDVILRLQYSI